MIRMHPSMDPQALEVYENGTHVGSVQWHAGRKRFVPDRPNCMFGISFAVLQAVTEELEKR